MGNAYLIKEHLNDFNGDAALYRCDPPMADDDGDAVEHVVVSATVVPYVGGVETYIFPADTEGNVTDWGELAGSYKGGMDHSAALRNAGYDIMDEE